MLYSYQVARACGITMRAVRLAAQQGRLKAIRDPKRPKLWRYTPESVAAFQAWRASCK